LSVVCSIRSREPEERSKEEEEEEEEGEGRDLVLGKIKDGREKGMPVLGPVPLDDLDEDDDDLFDHEALRSSKSLEGSKDGLLETLHLWSRKVCPLGPDAVLQKVTSKVDHRPVRREQQLDTDFAGLCGIRLDLFDPLLKKGFRWFRGVSNQEVMHDGGRETRRKGTTSRARR